MSESNLDTSVPKFKKDEAVQGSEQSDKSDSEDEEDSFREKNSVHSSDEEGEDVLDGLGAAGEGDVEAVR